MCGIGGIINLSKEKVEEPELQLIAAELKERGPDHQGFWIKDNLGFIHTRLSIIDVSNAGNQPMLRNEVLITFNGEIYNFKDLRNELLSQGHTFSSNSDTEVILNGYAEWGIEELLKKLDGMFAFCLYDITSAQLFLCRDRFGKKPLYVFRDKERIVFSSEIRPISKLQKNLTIDYQSLDYYLTELSMPQPRTIWNEVCQVASSCYKKINLVDYSIQDISYYQCSINKVVNFDENNLLIELERKMTDAVLKRTVSDVPIGCFLSGGVDSGLVVSTLAKNSKERVKTFSIGFNDKEYSELEIAKIVAKKYNTDHTEILVDSGNVSDMLVNLLKYIGEPFADPSILPTYFVCREISKYVKVALSGDGGDEVFGGYGVFLTAYMTDKFIENTPNKSLRKIKAVGNQLLSRIGMSANSYALYNSFYNMSGSDKLNRYMGFNFEEKKFLYASNLVGNANYSLNILNRIWDKNDTTSSITNALFLSSLETRLLHGYLVKVDRMSMKNSLEVRSPFLDKDLIEFSFSINNNLVFGNGKSTKYLLKKIVERNYDSDIFSRKKRGFGLPIKKWLKSDLKQMVYDVLLSSSFKNRGLFNYNYVEKLIDDHMNKHVDNTHKIWALLCLELWFQQIND